MSRCGALSLAFLALVAVAGAQPGIAGAPGGQCPTFITFTAPDGCSSCACSVDARMTDCTRSTCPDPGNYTINECVENALYVGTDGCNQCQCNAWRSFSWCTRKICLLSEASPPAAAAQPPRVPLRPSFPTQRPPFTPSLAGSSPLRPPLTPARRTTADHASSGSSASAGTPPPSRNRGSTRFVASATPRRPPSYSTTQGGEQ